MLAERCVEDLAPEVAQAELLARVGNELARLAAGVGDFEAKLSPVMRELARSHQHLVADLQHLDLLGQSLAALAGVMARLGAAGTAVVDPRLVIGELPLRDMADRLWGIAAAPSDEGFELF